MAAAPDLFAFFVDTILPVASLLDHIVELDFVSFRALTGFC